MAITKRMKRGLEVAFGRGCLLTLPGLLLLGACGQRDAAAASTPPLATDPDSITLRAKPGGPEVQDATGRRKDEPALRRGYGTVDMRFNPCVTRVNDHTLRGEACSSGFVIYGPYVSVPGDAEVEVVFDVKPSAKVEIYSDVVARMGAQPLASLNRQVVDAGTTRRLGYKVHVFAPDTNVESRVGLVADSPVEFEIANLTMTVR